MEFPIKTPFINTFKLETNIVATTEDCEFILTLASKLFINTTEVINDGKCEIKFENVSDCYACTHGAKQASKC